TALVASVANPKAFRSGRGLLGMDRAGAEAELERRQGQTRQYQQTRRPLSAQSIHDRRARRDPLCQDPRHRAPTVAHHIISQATDQGRRHRVANKLARMASAMSAKHETDKK